MVKTSILLFFYNKVYHVLFQLQEVWKELEISAILPRNAMAELPVEARFAVALYFRRQVVAF